MSGTWSRRLCWRNKISSHLVDEALQAFKIRGRFGTREWSGRIGHSQKIQRINVPVFVRIVAGKKPSDVFFEKLERGPLIRERFQISDVHLVKVKTVKTFQYFVYAERTHEIERRVHTTAFSNRGLAR